MGSFFGGLLGDTKKKMAAHNARIAAAGRGETAPRKASSKGKVVKKKKRTVRNQRSLRNATKY